jgi:hypothetical protein
MSIKIIVEGNNKLSEWNERQLKKRLKRFFNRSDLKLIFIFRDEK